MKYGTLINGDWTFEAMNYDYVSSITMTTDANNKAHIALLHDGGIIEDDQLPSMWMASNHIGGLLTYINNTSGDWVSENILNTAPLDSEGFSFNPKMAVDNDGQNVAFMIGALGNDAVGCYASKTDGVWTVVKDLDSEGISYEDGLNQTMASLAADSEGMFHVALAWDDNAGGKNYTYYMTDYHGELSWELVAKDSLYPLMMLDQQDVPHILYYDYVTEEFKYMILTPHSDPSFDAIQNIGTLTEGVTGSVTVTVENNGMAPYEVSGISSLSNTVSVPAASLDTVIYPGTSGSFELVVTTDVLGNYESEITLNSNSETGVETITLNGHIEALGSYDDLETLEIQSSGFTSIVFDEGTTLYSVTNEDNVGSVTIYAKTANPEATLSIGGSSPVHTSSGSQLIELIDGSGDIPVTVTSQDGQSQQTYIIRVRNLIVTTDQILSTMIGYTYHDELSGQGGFGGYNWSAAGLPNGLSIDATSGIISGTSNQGGIFNVTVTLEDNIGTIYNKVIVLNVLTATGQGGYIAKPQETLGLTVGFTNESTTKFTVDSGKTGLVYAPVVFDSVLGHSGQEVAVFIHYRNNVQIGMNYIKVDLDDGMTIGAAFNVQSGDVIKVFVYDQLDSSLDASTLL